MHVLADGEEIVGRDRFLVAEALLIAAAMLCRRGVDSNANDMEQLLNGWFDPLELASWMNDGEPLGPKPAA